MTDKKTTPWWRGASVYQIYVRSFCDWNGDGQGDLAGVLSKLDYLVDLGVDAVWLSPIHPSPNRDWGYDVADYEAVHPDYGTMADFEALLAAAHERGIRILLDEPLAHTSDEHAWFHESLEGGDKADWYVWADAKPDGTAPNNWLSAFGGPAWAYQPLRRKAYHHKFLRQQPKLNWHNPDTRQAILGVLDFWLDKGVDGFRLDVANAYLHDATLTDNPVETSTGNWRWAAVANFQKHWNDSNLVENIPVLDEVRRTVDKHRDRFAFGEFSEEAARCGGFAAPDEGLHAGYSFPLLQAHKLNAKFIRDHFTMLEDHPAHWPCLSFCNHDIMRTVSRFGDGSPELAKLMLAVLLALRGTVLIYQGEELGLPEVELLREQLRDPVGDVYWPAHKGRDGCRTPMPWSHGPSLGFSAGTPWLPAAAEHVGLTVEIQEQNPDSPLNFTRALIAARKASVALRLGDITFLDTPEPLLAFERTHGDERIRCVFNMSGTAISGSLPEGETLLACGEIDGGHLGPYGLRISRLG
ncbi:MAG: alpha-glucosidase family protein [Caulobacter sp.]|nr:alpha-glucosidase family protein [Caulobacter sp.]